MLKTFTAMIAWVTLVLTLSACGGGGGGGDGGGGGLSSPPQQQPQQAATPKPIDAANAIAFSTVERAKNVYVTPDGSFTVLTAGAGYSQAWIRDCATGVRAAYMAIGDDAAKGCASLHMLKQREDGYVNDLVDSTGNVAKNPVEADQESSLVIAVSEYIDLSKNYSFLGSAIGGKTVIDHLGSALNYVWLNERDADTGLVKNGHTIDWGDVSIDATDQSLTDSHPVVGIYTNAMYAMAIKDYIDLLSQNIQSNADSIKLWQERLQALKNSIVSTLWSPERGYFLMHKDITPISLPVNEDDMFPMGGNAVAIQAGLATSAMANSIFDKALQMQAKYKAPTISGVLYPPYPDGVYKHPAVNHSFQYQNGGLWDWFGLRLISAMLENGRPVDACKSLNEIATKIVRNQTFSEWDSPDGAPMGSKDYMGAAGEYISTVAMLKDYAAKKGDPCPSLH